MAKVVRLDNMAATKVPSLIKSAKYFVDETATAIENGELVTVGAFVDGEREVHEATAPATGDVNVGIVCTPELIYDQCGVGDTDLANFTNKAGEIIRVMLLQAGDIFSIAGEDAGADKTVGDVVVAKFMGAETAGRYTYNVYEVQ